MIFELFRVDYFVFTLNKRQYWANPNEVIKTDKISGQAGDKITADVVQLTKIGDELTIGQPDIPGVSLNLEIVEQGKEKKQYGLKYKPKGNYRRRWGFRRQFTRVKVLETAEK